MPAPTSPPPARPRLGPASCPALGRVRCDHGVAELIASIAARRTDVVMDISTGAADDPWQLAASLAALGDERLTDIAHGGELWAEFKDHCLATGQGATASALGDWIGSRRLTSKQVERLTSLVRRDDQDF